MGQPSPKRILIVDDESSICRVLTDLLRLDGHDSTVAQTGGEAIELCKARQFDLVLLDFQLPEMTGDQISNMIRCSNPKQKIVLMSGHKLQPTMDNADHCVRKPFTAQVIRDAIERFAA
jgi:CheY-like chemotaxis protein